MTDARLLAVIARYVRARFALPTTQLAARVARLAAAAGRPPDEFAAQLSLDDLYLASACAAGEDAAWAECQRLHFPFIRDFAARQLPDVAARDIADQVIADLWQRGKIGRYEGRSSLRTWIGTVVANAAANVRRSPERLRHLDSEEAATLPVPPPDPVVADAGRALAAIVRDAIGGLPSADKVLLQLYYEQGLTLAAMEVALRLSPATLSRRLAALRKRLRDEVDRRARKTAGIPVVELRRGVSLERLELDLSAALSADVAHGWKASRIRLSKE